MKSTVQSLLVLLVLVAPTLALSGDTHEYTQFGHSIYIGPDQKTGDVTCFLCSVRVRGQVGGEITTFGGNVTLEDSASVGGDVTAFGGQGWLFVIFGLPLLIFAGIIALIVWLVQRRQRPAQTYARAA